MSPVTQLYVSVDGSTKESLKKIDRPLFKDFWERYLESLKALSEKGQRTVYRLTLVKAFNTDEIENYAKLVSLGNPDFIEIKVTYSLFYSVITAIIHVFKMENSYILVKIIVLCSFHLVGRNALYVLLLARIPNENEQ